VDLPILGEFRGRGRTVAHGIPSRPHPAFPLGLADHHGGRTATRSEGSAMVGPIKPCGMGPTRNAA
jgi:hypothetical protein